MSVLTKARRLFARQPQLSEHTVAHSKVDAAVLGDWRKRAPMLAEAMAEPPTVGFEREEDGRTVSAEGPLDSRVWERLAGDVFYEFFGRSEPEILDESSIDPRYHVNRALADKHSREDSFREQHAKTRGEGFEASLGTLAALDSLRKSYEDELREHGQRQNDIAQAQDTLADLDQQMGELRERRQDADESEIEDIDAQMRDMGKAKAAQKAALAAQERAQDAGAVQMAAATRQAAQKAAQAAGEAVEQAASMVGVGPGKQPGQRVRLDPEAMFALAQRYAQSEILRRVAQMMGRLELSMGSKRRSMRKGGSEEMVDVELGRDLQFVLPQEKMLMRHPMGRMDFFRRYQEQSLMQFEMWSEQELKRGPVIAVCDGSSSMSGPRRVWAKAAALACCGIANREKRNAAVVEFGSPGQHIERRFPKEHPLDPVVAADWAEHFFDSGTSILTGLQLAASLIRMEAPFHAADIVLLTDGWDNLTDDDIALRDELQEMGVRIHGIMIGSDRMDYLEAVCESITQIEDIDLGGPNAASDKLAVNLT